MSRVWTLTFVLWRGRMNRQEKRWTGVSGEHTWVVFKFQSSNSPASLVITFSLFRFSYFLTCSLFHQDANLCFISNKSDNSQTFAHFVFSD